MAKQSNTISAIAAESKTVENLPIKDYRKHAMSIANTASEGTLQTTLALMGFYGARKGGEKFDFNTEVFVPFSEEYYRPEKRRKPLKGFSPDGKHEAKSSALTQLRGYTHFVTAGQNKTHDLSSVVKAVLGDLRIATIGIGAKGALVTKIVTDAKGKLPVAGDVDKAVVDKITVEDGKTNAVTVAKSLRSRLAALTADTDFVAALNPTTAALFNALTESTVAFAQAVIGTKAGKPGEAEAKANNDLLAAAAKLVAPAEKTKRRARAS